MKCYCDIYYLLIIIFSLVLIGEGLNVSTLFKNYFHIEN